MYPPLEPDLPARHEASRRRLLQTLLSRRDSPSNDSAPAPTPSGPGAAFLPDPGSGKVRTAEILEACLETDPPTPAVEAWVSALARKLEVARILRASYGADLKPVDRDELGLDSYAALAELLARRALEGDLSSLSTLSKVIDVLDWATATGSGQPPLSTTAAAWAADAVEVELECVERLRSERLPAPAAAATPAATPALPSPGPGVLGGVGLLAADTGRARAYIDLLAAAGLVPAAAVVVQTRGASTAPATGAATPLFDNVTPLPAALSRAGVRFTSVSAERLDDPALVAAVASLPQLVVIAGPPGALLGPAFFGLEDKRYLHVHPGRLPDYRGSTPMYYQLLAEGGFTATALFIEESIDTGPIVAARDFAPPYDPTSIDLAFDPWMRAVLLREVLGRYAAGEELLGHPQPDGGTTYFVIHPILRNVATFRNEGGDSRSTVSKSGPAQRPAKNGGRGSNGSARATDALRDPAKNQNAWPSWCQEAAAALHLPESTRPVDRIAFAIHAAELINHYRSIWELLDPAGFELVYASADPRDNARVFSFAQAHGYSASFVGDVIEQGRVFEAVVSNHIASAGNLGTAFVVQRIGRRQVRLMYSLGKDGWNFRPWNNDYDLIMCFGPYQAGKLAEFEHPRVVQIGYPRFDRFFSMPVSKREMVARLGADPDKPTLVWLPTWAAECSIPAFADTIAGLRDEMNVLVKVHPLTATTEPDHMAALADAGLQTVTDINFDNVDLFYAADAVAVDYGGSPFGAVYSDRDMVLLNTPEPANREFELSPEGSLDRRLREWILNIDPGEGQLVRDYLQDSAAREQQRVVRRTLRGSLFAPFDGCSAQAAALVLKNLESICR
jgi:folate-dependent phosphoribosylglycinamide formyltransferase PurN